VRGLGRRDRPVGVLAAALGHQGHQLLGGRAADLELLVGLDPVAADEHGVTPDVVHPGPFRGLPQTLGRAEPADNVLPTRGWA